MIKRILVPLDPSPYSKSALNLACIIAKVYDAELTGLVILDIPGIEDSIGPVPIGGLYYAEKLEKEKKEEAQKRIDGLLKEFEKKCAKEKVKYQVAERQGSPSNQILKESIYYDLVMIGLRTYFHFETSEEYGKSLDNLLKESITPIYGIPDKIPFSEKPDRRIRVLLAFDGSPLSARAMKCFMQLANPDLYEITLLNASEEREKGEYVLTQAERYLKSHGIKNLKKDWTSEDIIDVVDKEYYEKMDAFVVGAHAAEGIFDFFVGSLTKFLVKRGKKPVLIGK